MSETARTEAGSRPVLALIAVLAAVGAGAAVVDHAWFDSTPPDWPWVAPFVALLVTGGYLLVRFRYKDEIESLDLFEAVLAPVLFVYGGWLAVAMVAVANAIAELLHRDPPLKAAFNVAQWMAATGAGVLVLSALRGGRELTWHNVGALVVALLVVLLVNHLAFSAVIALSQGHSLRRVASGLRTLIVPGWLVGGGLNVAFGLLFVAAYQWDPAVVPLFFVPLVALSWAQRAYAAARADEVRVQALHRASAMLAGPVDPIDAVMPFLDEVRACFEAEAVELVLVEGDEHSVYRSPQTSAPLAAALTNSLLSLPEPARLTSQAAHPEGWRDCLAAPLLDGAEVVGVLCTYNRTGLEGFEGGELSVLAALASDVVAALQRRRLVREVVDERQKLRDIIDNASDGIFAVAPEGTIVSWNPALEEITGYSAAEMVGTQRLPLLRPRAKDGRAVLVERWATSVAAVPADLQIVTSTGEVRWLACSYRTAKADGGRPGSLIVVARDVTKVHELELLREEFVATVSHELRTPLAPIKGWASTLLDHGELLDEEQRREAMEAILRQAQRLERLIVNLLETSKIEHGHVDLTATDVDVGVVARRVVDDYRSAWPRRQFRLVGDELGCCAHAKELWVEQILSNLVSNAVKYSPPEGPVEVVVSHTGGDVAISVGDHGCGIPTQELERIFERFYRVSESGTQAGTGLGLYIAQQLAAEIGGRVSVESVPGVGSTFALELPVASRLVAI